jgi:hypothetical protein
MKKTILIILCLVIGFVGGYFYKSFKGKEITDRQASYGATKLIGIQPDVAIGRADSEIDKGIEGNPERGTHLKDKL